MPLLFAYGINRVFHDMAHMVSIGCMKIYLNHGTCA